MTETQQPIFIPWYKDNKMLSCFPCTIKKSIFALIPSTLCPLDPCTPGDGILNKY